MTQIFKEYPSYLNILATDIPPFPPRNSFSLLGSDVHHLLITRFFDCCCARCRDPTELGTQLSSLVCQQCRLHNISSYSLPSCTLDVWRCEACGSSTPAVEAVALVKQFVDKIETLTKTQRYILDNPMIQIFFTSLSTSK